MRNISCKQGRPFCCCCFGKQHKYTLNSTLDVEIVSKMWECFKTLKKHTLLQNILKKMLIKLYNDGAVNHYPCPIEKTSSPKGKRSLT